jgi:hypothetical protein
VSATTSQLRAAYYSRDRVGVSFERPRAGGSSGGGGSSTSGGHTSVSNSNTSPVANDSWASRGQKRQLQQVYDQYPPLSSGGDAYARPRRLGSPGVFAARSSAATNSSTTVVASSSAVSPAAPRLDLGPPREDPSIYDPPGGDSQSPRDNTRYETWTSKQLRKKCSHLKLRGLKNVKKHVMVEALYRYYRNQRLKEAAGASSTLADGGASSAAATASGSSMTSPQRQHQSVRRRSLGGSSAANAFGTSGGASATSSTASGRGNEWQSGGLGMAEARTHHDEGYFSGSSRGTRSATYHSSSSPPSAGAVSSALAGATNELRLQHARQVMARLASPSGLIPSHRRYASADEESKGGETLYKEVPVTSEDVVRLVDVVLSPEFVERLANELSRWQFWVDIREKYVSLLQRQGPSLDGSSSVSSGSGERSSVPRNFKWSSMQLWEIWKELTFAYTKTCFEFTAAGMKSEPIHACVGWGPMRK